MVIRRPTTFVLGAGASKDFGFPTGYELLQRVVNDFGGGSCRDIMRELTNFSDTEIDEFRDALHYSASYSVDAFLERRPYFMPIGKAAIAAVLIGHENAEHIFDDPHNKNWMRYLFGRMQGSSFAEFQENNVCFITFNYDRVWEHFLCTALQKSWGVSEDIAGAVVRMHIPIIHLHGQIGFLPWQQGANVRLFNTDLDVRKLGAAAELIRVVHEGVEDRHEQFKQAKEFIKKSERTYFLGVGTSKVNLERLGESDFPPNRAFGTEKGLTDAQFKEAHKRYAPRIRFLRHTDCWDLISNVVEWE